MDIKMMKIMDTNGANVYVCKRLYLEVTCYNHNDILFLFYPHQVRQLLDLVAGFDLDMNTTDIVLTFCTFPLICFHINEQYYLVSKLI